MQVPASCPLRTMGRSRLQRTKPGLDYRVAVVWTRPPHRRVSAQATAYPTPQSPLPVTAHRSTMVPADGFVKAQGRDHTKRPETCDFEPWAAGGGRGDAAGFGSLTAPKPQDDTGTGGNRYAKKAPRQPGQSGWILDSGMQVCSVPARSVPQSGRSLCPDPPAPPAWVQPGQARYRCTANNAGQPYGRRRTWGMHRPTVTAAVASLCA